MRPPHLLRGILFDFDGVLIDSEPLHQASLADMTERMGRRLTRSELESFKGTTQARTTQMLRDLFPSLGVPVETHLAERLAGVMAAVTEIAAMPGAIEFMKRRKVLNVKLALATSGPRSYQEPLCDAAGLSPLFDAVVTGDDVTHGKPNPEPYLLAAKRLRLEPGECAVIEDSLNGIRSGLAAGCFTIGFASTVSTKALTVAGAHAAAHSFAELESLFAMR